MSIFFTINQLKKREIEVARKSITGAKVSILNNQFDQYDPKSRKYVTTVNMTTQIILNIDFQ